MKFSNPIISLIAISFISISLAGCGNSNNQNHPHNNNNLAAESISNGPLTKEQVEDHWDKIENVAPHYLHKNKFINYSIHFDTKRHIIMVKINKETIKKMRSDEINGILRNSVKNEIFSSLTSEVKEIQSHAQYKNNAKQVIIEAKNYPSIRVTVD